MSNPDLSLTDYDTWVLDLDDTLYPPDNGLAEQMMAHIRDYLRAFYGTDEPGARRIQSELIAGHGTILRGMMVTQNIDPAEFLAFERRIDYSALRPDPQLTEALTLLPGRKLVYTNGSAWHAEQTLSRLGLSGRFDGIFDILTGDLVPKPHPDSYARFVERYVIDPTRAIMFDDRDANLTVPAQLGMATVLVSGPARSGPAPYEPLGPKRWRTWDMVGLLRSLTGSAIAAQEAVSPHE
jgi:putative hydrolase of the HAD superfamily